MHQQTKLKRLLQYLNFKDVKATAMKGVTLDDAEPSETGGEVYLDDDIGE